MVGSAVALSAVLDLERCAALRDLRGDKTGGVELRRIAVDPSHSTCPTCRMSVSIAHVTIHSVSDHDVQCKVR